VVTYFAGKHYQRVVNGTAVVVHTKCAERKTYMLGSRVVAVRTDGVLSFVITDHLGSTTAMTNEAGELVSRLRYTAFGERREADEDGTPGTKYRFTSQLQQAEAGLIFFNSRFYDPSLNHFISADTIVPNPGAAVSYNRYAYVSWNPINRTDPTGHYEDCDGDPCPSMPVPSGDESDLKIPIPNTGEESDASDNKPDQNDININIVRWLQIGSEGTIYVPDYNGDYLNDPTVTSYNKIVTAVGLIDWILRWFPQLTYKKPVSSRSNLGWGFTAKSSNSGIITLSQIKILTWSEDAWFVNVEYINEKNKSRFLEGVKLQPGVGYTTTNAPSAFVNTSPLTVSISFQCFSCVNFGNGPTKLVFRDSIILPANSLNKQIEPRKPPLTLPTNRVLFR
jgi:RHS repeat-associated protein